MVAVVAVVGGATLAVFRPFAGKADSGSSSDNSPTTATVARERLTARTPVSGTLGYTGSHTVVNRVSGSYTKLPKVGGTYKRGDVLYRVNGEPVVLFTGAVPSYRALSNGDKGSDVKQLNKNLAALGYDAGGYLDSTSRTFSDATEYAVKELQDDLNVEETGKLKLGQVAYVPLTKSRVTGVNVTRGAIASPGPVLTLSSTERSVTVKIEASIQSDVERGDDVTITLPDLKTTPGKVTRVGTVATRSSSTGSSTIDVTVEPTDPKATGSLDKAPVLVSIVTDSADDVLTVPVNALLALAGGGYAVEVVQTGGTHKLVPVALGLFDSSAGKVAVSGSGLAVGQRVVVPTS